MFDTRPDQRGARQSSLALGIERLGLVAFKFPGLLLALLILLTIVAFVGISKIRVDDSLSQLFRSDTPDFRLYERVTRQFPSSEYDVLVVVEGKSVLERDALEHLRELVTDLQLVDGANGLISLFSAREPPEGSHLPAPLFPDELPKGAEFRQLIAKVKNNQLINGKLLSEDGQLALVVLSLNPDSTSAGRLPSIVDEIRDLVTTDLQGSGLKGELSGVPIMQLEIRQALERDRLLYNSIGFAAGCLIAIAFFRRVSFMIIAAAPPFIAIVLSLGALGWLGFRLNMFLNVMTPLIMVISFSDSMQLTFATRDHLMSGRSKREALRTAIHVVGPACVLTHTTAAISFIALQFSNSDLIRTFGQAGLLSTAIALVVVLVLVPLLGIFLIRDRDILALTTSPRDPGVNALRTFCLWIAKRMVIRPGFYSLVGLLVVVMLGLNDTTLRPRYQLADQSPDKQQAMEASRHIDAKLTGANPLDVLIELPKGANLYEPAVLSLIKAVHDTVEKQAGVGNVWSVETLRRWLSENAHGATPDIVKEYVDALPPFLTRRFISADETAVLVSGRIPDVDSSELLPVIKRLNAQLAAIRTEHPGYRIEITGLAVISAENSAAMIGRLSVGLTVEVIFISAFIGLVFRSLMVGIASIMPSVFPVLLSGTVLKTLGLGLQFTSAVALIVSFGLGLSATIHFLNRMRSEGRPGDDPAIAVEQATVRIGPALILTSVVLACGLIVTVFSDLPSLRLFGWLSSFAMLSALTADLLILRPTITYLIRLSNRRSNTAKLLQREL